MYNRRLFVVVCYLFALFLCCSCYQEKEFDYDETLAGSVSFMGERLCECLIDGVKANSGKDEYVHIAIDNPSDIRLQFSFIVNTPDYILYCFPYQSDFWRFYIDPIPVSGIKGDVSFNEDVYLYYGPGPDHTVVYGYYGNVKGWLKNSNYLAAHPGTRGNRVQGEFSGEVTFTWQDAEKVNHTLVLNNFVWR